MKPLIIFLCVISVCIFALFFLPTNNVFSSLRMGPNGCTPRGDSVNLSGCDFSALIAGMSYQTITNSDLSNTSFYALDISSSNFTSSNFTNAN